MSDEGCECVREGMGGRGEVNYRSTSLIVKKDIMNFLGEAEGEDEEAPTSPPAKKSVRHPAIADIYDAGCNIKYADNLWRRKREGKRERENKRERERERDVSSPE